MGTWRPKHVERLCRNKTCTVLHQVGVLFDWVAEVAVGQYSPVGVLVVDDKQGEAPVFIVGRSAASDGSSARHSRTCTKQAAVVACSSELSYNLTNFEVSVAKIQSTSLLMQ